ncbi:hypothetical protein LguiA_004921 [Lonicera macranthoides]
MYPLKKTKTIMILRLYVIRNGPEALKQLVEVDHSFLNSQDREGNTNLAQSCSLETIGGKEKKFLRLNFYVILGLYFSRWVGCIYMFKP